MRFIYRKDVEQRYHLSLKKADSYKEKIETLRSKIEKLQSEYQKVQEEAWQWREKAAGANGLLHSPNWRGDKLEVI